MLVRFKLAALEETQPHEYLVRFALGGLMLAFPAIFCASATLIEKHERTKKRSKGLHGARRGKEAAALDAAGAAWGSIAMAAFAQSTSPPTSPAASPPLSAAQSVGSPSIGVDQATSAMNAMPR